MSLLDTVIETELHMAHGILIDELPSTFTWHQLGSRIMWLYRQPNTETRRSIRNGI